MRDVLARLEVPAHGVDLFVLAGGSGRTLAWGPGHLAGTAPVGAPGNAVVGGHRDTHFAFLRHLRTSEEIHVEDAAGRLPGGPQRYVVVAEAAADASPSGY